MPWRGPQEPREFPTLGYLIAEWIEARCAIPDREDRGQKLILTNEQIWFLLNFYRLRADACEDQPGRALHWTRGGQLVRPQKWGKGPFSAAVICAEAAGPTRFAGWDAVGEPIGRPRPTPLIQVMATSEDQSGNVWGALRPMIELGAIRADIEDTGETRIHVPGGGKIEPVTTRTLSRLGAKATFVVHDQAESYTKRNGLRQAADAQRRNLAGMDGRFLETPNAWDPADESVAQYTQTEPGVYVDDVDPGKGSIRNKRERRAMLKKVYGDSWRRPEPMEPGRRVNGWVVLDRIEDEIEALLPRDPAQAERWFCNRKKASEGAAFDPEVWASLKRLEPLVFAAPAQKREWAVAGFDGARFHDSTGLIGTHVELGHQWVAGCWEKPADLDDESWEVDPTDVTAALEEMFDTWRIWRIYCDPPYWDDTIDGWIGRWGARRIVKWWTLRDRAMAFAVRAYLDAMTGRDLTHDGDSRFARHITNARKRETLVKDEDGQRMHTLRKDHPRSPDKIDLAVCGCISWTARLEAVADGVLRKPKGGTGWSF